MDIALRPNVIGAAILGVLALLVLMMGQMAGQIRVDVQAQPHQNAKTIFTVVIADDEPIQLASTTVAVEVVIRVLGYEPRILPAVNSALAISLALTGNNGGQVNAVFLDGSYAKNLMDWMIPDPSGFDDFAEGNTLAAFLRVSGYTGPIILTSTVPQDYVDEPGGENFAAALKKQDFWANPQNFVEAIRQILK